MDEHGQNARPTAEPVDNASSDESGGANKHLAMTTSDGMFSGPENPTSEYRYVCHYSNECPTHLGFLGLLLAILQARG